MAVAHRHRWDLWGSEDGGGEQRIFFAHGHRWDFWAGGANDAAVVFNYTTCRSTGLNRKAGTKGPLKLTGKK